MSSLRRIFAVIETVVANQADGMSFTDIVVATGTPKASAHRILHELVDVGILAYTPQTGRYRGSLKLAALGSEVMAQFDLRALVHPYLQALHEETGHTCHVGMRDGEGGVYLDKIEPSGYGIKLFSEVGKRFPLHCTGMGKVLLAHGGSALQERVLSRPLEAVTNRTITDPALLRAELESIRKLGYAEDREEITRGVMCVAAPIFAVGDEVVAAASVTFPSYVSEEKGVGDVLDALLRHTAAMSGTLARG